MPTMSIFGDVDGDGSFTVKAGSEGTFSALRVDEGTYAIDFTPDFAESPVVMVTFRDEGIVDQKEDVALVRPTSGQCLVFTRNSANADRQDADFSFVAIGLAAEPGAVVDAPVESGPGMDTEAGVEHNEPPEVPPEE